MTMAVGVPGLFYMQKIFWAFIGAAIATATIANAINKILCYQRISARKSPDAAKPKSAFFRTHATLAAIIREFSSYSIPLSIKNWHIYLPTAGPVTIIVGYVVLIVVCCFYRLNPKNYLEFEDIGYRSGFIAVCQMPLIILLSSKRNIIGLLTGMGYERLNWLHRWTARCLLFTVIIHLGYWFTEWDKFDYAMIKIKTDKLTQRGITAGAMLGWIVFSSIAPIRKLSYEIFVIQHIISWFGFFVTLYYHIPGENRIWIWLPLGFWAFDRFARAVYMLVANLAALHKNSSGFLSCKATFEPLDDTHTRITIANPPITWQAGQHLFLTCHVLAPFTAHPFTIASLPKDGKIEFVVSAKKGATRKFFKYAKKVWPSLPSVQSSVRGRAVLIDGPYSRIRSMRQFDSIVLIAGSTGATFTVPLMRDVVQQWMGTDSTSHKRTDFLTPAGAVTRHIRFIWVVKKQSTIRWFATQLSSVIRDVEALREQGHDVAVEISIYVTCDETITSGNSHPNGDRTGAHVRVSTSRPESPLDEKKDYTTSIAEVSSSTSATKECCCTRILTDEDAITALCNCASKRQQRDSTSSTSPSLQKSLSSNLVDLDIIILAGRPHIPNIIRKTAELALGEMAVAVCGPPGLVQCTRNAVVGISDDRAVHKGTGAQGIYVHAEVFGYA
ncbi:metalloreductase [Amylocarpus encephaloides]|uniref:ferric-chelate reductase (NADPH) n=1 Tax=Amylocarpus encephaloides TaxID=45428 RepID=A0A9P8C9S2_9HELO|nr:metalloreductase [Amylocarpus encephaloides]